MLYVCRFYIIKTMPSSETECCLQSPLWTNKRLGWFWAIPFAFTILPIERYGNLDERQQLLIGNIYFVVPVISNSSVERGRLCLMTRWEYYYSADLDLGGQKYLDFGGRKYLDLGGQKYCCSANLARCSSSCERPRAPRPGLCCVWSSSCCWFVCIWRVVLGRWEGRRGTGCGGRGCESC